MADVGRPRSIDELTLKILEEAYSNDATDEQACFLAKISKQTLYNYQKENPEFIDRKVALKNMVKYQAKLAVKESLGNDKERTDTAKWYLERKDKTFKTKQDITSDDKPISILNGVISTNNGNSEDNIT